MNHNKFRRLGTMIDCSRGAVMNVETVKRWIDITSDLGYHTLMLYTEDTYEVDGQPYFGYLRGRYTQEELKEIDEYATKQGMELIPCIQTLAHLEAIFRWGQVYHEIQDCESILLADNEKTYELIDAMFSTLHKCFRSRIVNIGMDEAFMLGRGRYQDINGYQDRFDILLNHLIKVSEIAKKYDFELIMWGDMFFRLLHSADGGDYYDGNTNVPDKVSRLIPDNVNLIYWDYYSRDKARYDKNMQLHLAMKDNIWFAGGLWSWTGYAPHNQFSMEATKAAFEACIENGVKDVFLTMWGDDGAECSKFSLLPSLYYASEIAKGQNDMEAIKDGFYKKYGVSFDEFMLLDLIGTPNQNQEIVNPERYMLFNDYFLGVFDSTIEEGVSSTYISCSQKLKALEGNKEYGYLFATLRSLCDILAIKYELGEKTRKAYHAGEKSQLQDLIQDYDVLLGLLDDFYGCFHTQWFKENKPNGFELHDIRIGGLIQRTKHCRERIRSFVNGEVNALIELEEPLLDQAGNELEFERKPTWYMSWAANSIIDVI